MHSDVIFIPKGLPNGVDGLKAEHGGLERIDALVRGPAGVRRAPNIRDQLDDAAVGGATDT